MSYDEIFKLENKLNAAFNSSLDTRDIADELFDDKVVIVARNGETVDKKQILEMHTASQKPYSKIVVEKLDITVFDTSAIVHSLNTYYPVAAETFQIIFLRVWSKRDGQWRIVGGSATVLKNS